MSVKQMALVWELDLPANKKFILLAYADHADEYGEHVFPSLGRIAHKTGYSRDQVRRISRELQDAGLMELVEEATPTRAAEYRLLLEGGSKLPPLKKRGVANDPPRVGANDPPRVGAPVPPEPSLEPSVKDTSKDVDAKPSPKEGENRIRGDLLAYLRDELAGADVPLLRGREGRYAKELGGLIRRGVPEMALYKAADRIVERWNSDPHHKLDFDRALGDVRNGGPPQHAKSEARRRAEDIQSPGGGGARMHEKNDKPMNPLWYEATYGVDLALVEGWMDEGMGHSEIENRCKEAS